MRQGQEPQELGLHIIEITIYLWIKLLNLLLLLGLIEHIKCITRLGKLEFLLGYLSGSEIKIDIVLVILTEGLRVFGVLEVEDAALVGGVDDEEEGDYG